MCMRFSVILGIATGNCFPASAVVTVLVDGAPTTANISQLVVGDMVMVRLVRRLQRDVVKGIGLCFMLA